MAIVEADLDALLSDLGITVKRSELITLFRDIFHTIAVEQNVAGGGAVTPTVSIKTANYTLVLGDNGNIIEFNSASAVSCTVPPSSAVAFPVGALIEIDAIGAGQVSVVAGAGVTIRTPSSLSLRAQYSSLVLRNRATDDWIVAGDMT